MGLSSKIHKISRILTSGTDYRGILHEQQFWQFNKMHLQCEWCAACSKQPCCTHPPCNKQATIQHAASDHATRSKQPCSMQLTTMHHAVTTASNCTACNKQLWWPAYFSSVCMQLSHTLHANSGRVRLGP